MLDQRILTLIGALSEPGDRPRIAKKVAQALGADDILIFAKDPILKVFLPAPGFPQTLPEGHKWRDFVSGCKNQRHLNGNLISPYSKAIEAVLGISAPDDSVFVLLGGAPALLPSVEVSVLVPLVVAALFNEQIALIAKGEVEAESLAAERTKALATALDSTRRDLESALRKSTNILESITDAFFELDDKWRFAELNPQAEELLERNRSELLGKNIWEAYPDAVGSEFHTQYHEAAKTRRPVRFESFFPMKQAWFEVRVYPTLGGLAVYFSDINERKRASEELRQSQEWFRTTLHSIGDGVIAVNTDRSISFLNPVAESLTGWSLSEAHGRPMDEVFHIIHEKTRKIALNPVDRVLREGKVVGLANHTALIRKDGKEFVIEDSAAPIKNGKGEITGVVLVFRDVSQEYARNAQLEETYRQLQAQRSRLEAVLQQMPEGVMIAEPSGKLILRNAQMDVMLGGFLPCDSISDYGQYKGFRPTGAPYRPEEWPLARSLTRGETIHGEEIELERIDGGRAILSISSAPIRDEQGAIVAGVVIHHDITEAKRVESELRYQNYLTQTITDNAASCLFMMDKSRRPTFMNPAAKAVTGYESLDEFSEMRFHDAVHGKRPDGSDYPAEECPIYRAQVEMKTVRNQEEVFCRKDGTLFPVSYSVMPLVRNNEVVGSVLEFREITAQKEIENRLKLAVEERDQSLKTLATINEVGQRLTAELDLEKLVQQLTDAATQLTGAQFGALFYNAVNEQGKSYMLYTISGVPKEAFSKFPQPRATAVFHPTFVGEGTVRSDDITKDPRYGKNDPHRGMPAGHLPVKSYLAVSVKSRGGKVIGGLFFGHEKPGVFTEQSEKIVEGLAAQAAVAMDNARLYRSVQESVMARDEFLSIASHELKTPLTSLKLQAQMRDRNLSKGMTEAFTPERLRKMIDGDTRQVERLSRLIDDMLDISRISTGKLAMQPEKFDLCSLAQDVLERYMPQFESARSKVNLVCSNPVEGNWDRFRIEQVITNLFTNAMRYGAGKPIEVSISRVDHWAVLVVRDQGLGIAKENQKRIFERFERAISANEVSGLGLGLYIVKQILEMHGGTISVESELGQGAKFIVKLPALGVEA